MSSESTAYVVWSSPPMKSVFETDAILFDADLRQLSPFAR